MSLTEKEKQFMESIGYCFKDEQLFRTAMTHSSYVNENKHLGISNNERLEFLGDAVLDAVISDYLYDSLKNYEEGELTRVRAAVVCESSLAKSAAKINIGKYLFLGKGEENTGGRMRQSIMADGMEALIGAVYIDGGWEKARTFVLNVLAQVIDDAVNGRLYKDYKTTLQERLQAESEYSINYVTAKEEGPDHNKKFYVDLIVEGKILGSGTGKSKKEAEQNAAKDALKKLEQK